MLSEVKFLLGHQFINGVESGIVTDSRGLNVAIGHVITGISGGLSNSSFAPGGGLQKVPTMTLTGDLGQTAAKRLNGLNPLLDPPAAGQFGGVGSEATSAELVGDVDGMLLGTYLYATPQGQDLRTRLKSAPNTTNSIKLSSFLSEYYFPWENTGITMGIASGNGGSQMELSAQSRFSRFSEIYWSKNTSQTTKFRWNTIDQTIRFNDYYARQNSGVDYNGPDVSEALASNGMFELWLGQQISKSPTTFSKGTAANDYLIGTSFSDVIFGGDAGDTIVGNDGNDVLKGDGGNDSINGGNGNDMLIGGLGNDVLIGGAGDDILYGGADDDTLSGGAGVDYFVFDASTLNNGVDNIGNFDSGDKIVLVNQVPGFDAVISLQTKYYGGLAITTVGLRGLSLDNSSVTIATVSSVSDVLMSDFITYKNWVPA